MSGYWGQYIGENAALNQALIKDGEHRIDNASQAYSTAQYCFINFKERLEYPRNKSLGRKSVKGVPYLESMIFSNISEVAISGSKAYFSPWSLEPVNVDYTDELFGSGKFFHIFYVKVRCKNKIYGGEFDFPALLYLNPNRPLVTNSLDQSFIVIYKSRQNLPEAMGDIEIENLE